MQQGTLYMVNTIKNNKHKGETEKQMVRKDTKINQRIALKQRKTIIKPFQFIKKFARILTSYCTRAKKLKIEFST